MPSKLAAASQGAAGRVSGSFHLLDTGNGRWIVDCGVLFDEETSHGRLGEEETARRQLRFPLEALSARALLLTHAHADHMGRVPLLVHQGYRGTIYATPGTRAMAEVAFVSAIRFETCYPRHWTWSKRARESARKARKAFDAHWRQCPAAEGLAADDREQADATTQQLIDRFREQKPRVKVAVCRDCVQAELQEVMRLFRPVEYDQPVEIGPGVRATFLDAGHIPGSASILFEVTINGRTRRVLFSGDLGTELSPLYRGPKPAPDADAVFIETTYGAAERPATITGQRGEFRRALGEAAARKGIVWIPAFAIDRTQKVLYEIHLAQREKLLPDPIPVYCSSPTAQAVNDLYRKHQRDGWFAAEVAGDPAAWSPRGLLRNVPSYGSLPRPCILLSTTDLGFLPWMRRLAVDLLEDKNNAVFLVGYADPQSTAGQIMLGAERVEIDGRAVRVRAGVRSFECFTGHGSAADIDRWLSRVSKSATIVLVHGSPASLKARAEQLRSGGRERVVVADEGRWIDLLAP